MSLRAAAALAIAAAALAGCGGGDSGAEGFTASSFVAEANRYDAGLELGEPLPYPSSDALEVRTLRFEGTGAAPAAPGPQTPTDVHGSGNVAVFADQSEAIAEYERCEASLLICFRAANVALAFSGDMVPADLDRLTRALQAMAEDA